MEIAQPWHVLQDRQAFAKFTTNVKAIAKANLKNAKYFQVRLKCMCKTVQATGELLADDLELFSAMTMAAGTQSIQRPIISRHAA